MVEVRSKAAVVRYQALPLGVTLVKVSGVASMEALSSSHAQWQRAVNGVPMAAVADFTRAVVVLEAGDLRRWLADGGASVRRVPVGIVASEEQVEYFLRHAAEMAAHGVNRQVFLDRAQALAWAERHAARRLWTSSPDQRMAR